MLGEKTVYTWPRDAYEGPDQLSIYDLQEHLPGATKRHARMGQMLYTPAGQWHCGENKGLALSIQVGFLRPEALDEVIQKA